MPAAPAGSAIGYFEARPVHFNRLIFVGLVLLCIPRSGWSAGPPLLVPHPNYDLTVDLDITRHVAVVRQVVTWTNPCDRPAEELIFNAHSHYSLPEKDVGFMAKMLEILRMNPSEALDLDGPACQIQKAYLLETTPRPVGRATLPRKSTDSSTDETLPPPRRLPDKPVPGVKRIAQLELPFFFRPDNLTALVVRLPAPVAQGQTVSVALDFTMRLPQKQGRWGQWKGVTFLSNWQPVLAVYDSTGWQPTPFIPWHQPFFNEAGSFHALVTLPCNQKIACTGSIVSSRELGDGRREVEIQISCARDFAFLCSWRYAEFTGQVGPVHVRCMAFPEHEHYAKAMVGIACNAIETYSRWFGPYPYPEFTVAESYFGWNGNECAGLVMIDERIFGMPHVADGFVEYLLSHEVCHQWWYNVVGTNGYCETWMDEGLATYFAHRLLNLKYGKNSPMLHLPKGLEWLPNINRETYRYFGLYGTLGRGEACATVQDMPKYEHIVTLFSMCYDRGSKIVGMIEDRLGDAAFLDFMRLVYAKYHFRILRVAYFQRELEAYTGHSWHDFFQHWLYGADMTDWCVEHVNVQNLSDSRESTGACGKTIGPDKRTPCKVTVILKQKAEYNEQTVLGFSLDGSENYQVRVPILPAIQELELDDPPARIQALSDNRMRVDIYLPTRPTQIAVDPDQILVDPEPANNYWKPRVQWRFTPLYTLLDETDITTAYDRWNVVAGPWISAVVYPDPWYERSDIAGFRVGAYRTQQFEGGVYTGYRTDYRDIAVGIDGLRDHWPWPHTQVGFNAEHSLTSIDDRPTNRASVFGRYVFQYGDSLYLPPMNFLEGFGAIVENALPIPKHQLIQGEHFDHATLTGIHYHLDYLTPYWDPEGGFRLDATYAIGVPISGEHETFHRVDGQISTVKCLPDGLGWFSDTRIAGRLYGGIGLPDQGEYFPLGGSEALRGFDLSQRQGNAVWIASLEWRFPIVADVECDCLDHAVGLRAINGAAFYDVGNAYLKNQPLGPIAQSVGGGLRLDVVWFSIVERSTIRFDVAKTVNAATPLQFWLAFEVPF
jgi:hypothetical protein